MGVLRSWGLWDKSVWVVLLICLVCLCSVVVLKAAWLSDDSYITLRTVDNVWHGYGLRWNVIERVQTYSDPLWMLLLASVYGVTREAYFTTIAVSLACVAATIALILRRLPMAAAGLALLWLSTSRAFVEYSTSGLENPLSHLLLALFWLDALDDNNNATRVCLIAALCCLNRADLALLVAPRVIATLWRCPRGAALRAIGWGALPLIAWHGFALVYYGSPLPNTAFAKLGSGLPAMTLAQQGLYYLLESLMHDPVTLPTIIIAIISAIGIAIARSRKSVSVNVSASAMSLAIGLVLHLLYVIRVGGDFMSGRFLSAPFVCAVLFIAVQMDRATLKLNLRRPLAIAAVGALAMVLISASLIATESPLRLWKPLPADGDPLDGFHGIVSERLFYAPQTGLPAVLFKGERPANNTLARIGREHSGLPSVLVYGAVGLVGYHAGPALHMIDDFALTDPLLARRPAAVDPHNWRIGHFGRVVPTGYKESVEACLRHIFPHGAMMPSPHSCLEWSDTNQIADPAIARQYDRIRLVTQGPLFTVERWRAIVSLNLGG